MAIRTRRVGPRPAEIEVSLIDVPEFLEEINTDATVGQEVTGTVSGFNKMGAILDLGLPLPGFLHVSKVSATERINSIQDMFAAGDTVTARIMAIRRRAEGGRPAEIEVSLIDVPEFLEEINTDATVGQEV